MRILVTNDDGIHAPGLEGLRGDRAQDLRRRLGGRAGARPVRRVAFAVAQRSAAAAPGRRAALCREGHADRLRHHGRAPHHAGRPPDLVLSGVNRGRNAAEDVTLFRHRRRRDGRHACSASRRSRCRRPTPRRAGSSRTGRPRSTTRPTSSAACCKQGIPRDVLVNVNFPGLPAGRGEGHRGRRPRASATRSCCTSTRATTAAAIRITGSPMRAACGRPARTAPISPRSPTTASR